MHIQGRVGSMPLEPSDTPLLGRAATLDRPSS
jgi:hypothetical protein